MEAIVMVCLEVDTHAVVVGGFDMRMVWGLSGQPSVECDVRAWLLWNFGISVPRGMC